MTVPTLRVTGTESDRALPWITACVCTHNRSDYLRDCLDGLRAQTVGPDAFDILIVDSGSSAGEAFEIAALVAGVRNARLIRVDRPGLSLARNTAASSGAAGYMAFLDDDAVPAANWIAEIHVIVGNRFPAPAMVAGAIWPLWEAPLPRWWPPNLHGVLSIIETQGQGEFRRNGVAHTLEPYGANMIISISELVAQGGFLESIGRTGKTLLSDEEKVLAWHIQDRGNTVLYASTVYVYHQIQAERLTISWLLTRMYWQGISRVRSARYLGGEYCSRRELFRRLLVFMVLAPVALIPSACTWFIGLRWRWAYAHGFLRALTHGRMGVWTVKRR